MILPTGAGDLPEFARAALESVVFQSRALDGDLTLRQNLAYHAALHGIRRRDALPRIAEVLALVDLSDKAGARASTLSGGQQRRAEIARALLHRPQLLLLDEATAGLDLRARAEVLALTRRLIAEEGVSALWATHIFDEITPQDHVVLLHRGRVLADAPAAELMDGETLPAAFLRLTGRSCGSSSSPPASARSWGSRSRRPIAPMSFTRSMSPPACAA